MLEQILPLWNVFLKNKKEKTPLVMATLVKTQGSSYKKKGAMMLIDIKRQTYGLISGGCLENDLAEHAETVFSDEIAKIIDYDLSDDSIFGLGAGCDGTIQVLLQILNTKNSYQPFSLFNPLIEQAHYSCLSLNINIHSNYFSGFKYSCNSLNKLSDPEIESDKKLNSQDYSEIELIPPLKIAVVGTGKDIIPICQQIEFMNWHGYILDHRLNRLEIYNCFENINLIKIDLKNLSTNENLIKPFDAVILITHNIDRDVQYLSYFNQFDIPYFGLLGSISRRDNVLSKAQLSLKDLTNKLYAPIGIDLGSHSPEQIALSIIAEIQLNINNHSKFRKS
jgi:xanthine dehydrogenase accessory factor